MEVHVTPAGMQKSIALMHFLSQPLRPEKEQHSKEHLARCRQRTNNPRNLTVVTCAKETIQWRACGLFVALPDNEAHHFVDALLVPDVVDPNNPQVKERVALFIALS